MTALDILLVACIMTGFVVLRFGLPALFMWALRQTIQWIQQHSTAPAASS